VNELEFGHQIKQQLDRSLDLEPSTLNRLKLAREQALARQRVTEPMLVLAWADTIAGRLSGSPIAARMALAGAALVLALVGLQYWHWQQTPTVEEIEELDTALLTSELPINAYLDKNFDTWLKHSQR